MNILLQRRREPYKAMQCNLFSFPEVDRGLIFHAKTICQCQFLHVQLRQLDFPLKHEISLILKDIFKDI